MPSLVVTPRGDRIRWIDVPGGGPPRLFVHGLGASGAHHFAAALAHPLLVGRRSVVVDLLGYGASDRPSDLDHRTTTHAQVLARLLEHLDLGPVDVVAHSMGGAIAVELTSGWPDLVGRLVLVDANLDASTPLPGAGSSRGIAAWGERAFVEAPVGEVRGLVGDEWWSTLQMADRLAVHRNAVSLVDGVEPSWREQLLALPHDRTFLHPAPDGPPDGVEGLRAAGVDVVAVPDCGHVIMIDNPDGFARAVGAALLRDR